MGMISEARVTVYGEFVANFVEDCLANLCDPSGGIQTGPFGSQLHQQDYVPVGTPIITVEHLGENRIMHQDIPCVSDEDKERLSKYILRKGDIVFSRVGSVDRRSLVRDAENGWLFSGRCLRVRPDPDKIDPVYLSYFFGLPSFKEHIRAIAVGATMPSLNTEILSNVIIPYPQDLNEQRAIARILGSLDDKIEANRCMNETLEAIARAIFKSWFVDFDPVRAKAEGREPTGMDPETAAQFPDSFEETELGMVPKGWEAKLLGQTVCYINRGIQPKYIDDGGLKVINQKCIRNHQVDWTKARRHDPNFKPINDGRELQKGDILINSTGVGTLGRVAQILCLHEKVIVDSHVTIIRADSKIITWNVLGSMLIAQEAEIADLGEGTTGQTELSRERLKFLRVLVPSLDAQKMFDKATMPLRNLIQSNEMQNHALSEIRNSLLPKLLSGEVPAKVAGECL